MNRVMKEKLTVTLLFAVAAVPFSAGLHLLWTIITRGLKFFSFQMLFSLPGKNYYFGGEGGIFNAVAGTALLAFGGAAAALVFSLPAAVYLSVYMGKRSKRRAVTCAFLDILGGIPSIVYGAFGYAVLRACGLRSSLGGGIMALGLLCFPLMCRGMENALSSVSEELTEASCSLGAERGQTAFFVVLRQAFPGVISAFMLSLSRGMGDAATVLLTAGYTDRIPLSLNSPVASLPLSVFFQLSSPVQQVQEKAFVSALVLLLMVFFFSGVSRYLAGRTDLLTLK